MGQYYQFKVAKKMDSDLKTDYVTDYNVQKTYEPFGWKFGEYGGMEESSMKVLESLIHNTKSRCMIIGDYDKRALWDYWWNEYDGHWSIITRGAIEMKEQMIDVKWDGYIINWSDGTYIDLQEQMVKLGDKDLYNPLALLLQSEIPDYYHGWNQCHIGRRCWDVIEYREREEMKWEDKKDLEDRTKVFFFYQTGYNSEDDWKYVSIGWEAKLEEWKELEMIKKELSLFNEKYNGTEKVI